MKLILDRASSGYGHTIVLQDVSLEVGESEVVALIGANGAGKSTLCKLVSGVVPVRRGQMSFGDVAISGLSTAARIHLGIVHVPEGRQVFTALSVAENLELGGFALKGGVADIRKRREELCDQFPLLRDRYTTPAGNLSGGQQQILAIARGLMSRPRLIILDEPSLGLSPLLVDEIFRMISELRGRGIAVLLSEQNAKMSLEIADRGYVIENGRIALSGSGRELIASDEVASRYLGLGVELKDQDVNRGRELSAEIKKIAAID